MKIALLNGSPKANKSASEYMLASLKTLLPDDSEFYEFKLNQTTLSDADLKKIAEIDRLIFAFPLYVDGIPSHLLRCLAQMESFLSTMNVRETRVYALVNCGFYEGQQAGNALRMMKNWSNKANLQWGQGIGIGGGGFLASLEETSKKQAPVKNLWEALEIISSNIALHNEGENIYIVPNFSRTIYTFGGNLGWRSQIKKNGLRPKDLLTKK